MSTEPEPKFLAALRAARDTLAEVGSPAMFIGGVAVIALGVSRHTVDIDATVLAKQVSPERLVEAGRLHRLVPRMHDAIAFAHERQVLLLLHEPSFIPIDVTLAWLPFEEEALSASQEIDFGGVSIRVPRPDDLLLYKLVSFRPRDLEDAETLLLLHGKSMDLKRVDDILSQFCEALEDSQRIDTLAQLLKKAKLRRA